MQWLVRGERQYNFSSPDNNTFRFEVRKGDRYTGDSAGVERAEIGHAVRPTLATVDNHFSAEYKFMMEPGAANTAPWVVLGQLHTGVGTPPFEIVLQGNDKLKIIGKWGTDGGSASKATLFADTNNIQRGHWYTMKVDIKFDPYGNGHAQVWRDGVEIVDYAGPLGYTSQKAAQWNMGVYRATPPGGESLAVQYKDFDLTYGAAEIR
jgi:hypothetical protein